jgi:hypothetical protein
MIEIDWTADASGAVTKAEIPGRVYGVIQRLVTDPGHPTPTDHSITIEDETGVDVLEGAGANCVGGARHSIEVHRHVIGKTLTFRVAGNTTGGAKGKVRVYVQIPAALGAWR